eukprot:CAMPEP_0172404760 /NCGR_PEP_ID=MMETSP1061-20121228/64252_1 /TAXON_ID=37318 /ORGANISM="Pseudo-nitzschia pungens, Strain cf. pungens" /LENGTH=322 /DNA_ID=CAMNT_0013139687 /DNA_START=36 /DNA_END=1004 /DNA_ORIENTATION=-
MAPPTLRNSWIPLRIAALFLSMFAFYPASRISSTNAWHFSTTRSKRTHHGAISEKLGETEIGIIFKAESTTSDNVSSVNRYRTSPSSRRRLFSMISHQLLEGTALGFAALSSPGRPAFARNLPASNGADTSKVGTVAALIPLVTLRNNLKSLRLSVEEEQRNTDNGRPLDTITKSKTEFSFKIVAKDSSRGSATIPIREEAFKRIFDAYSDQVSYKQKFLDQNAFLVYYTKGYDGPGRDSLEKDPVNERQTLQFGARNEAWICWDDFLAEWDFYASSARGTADIEEVLLDMMKYLSNTIQAVDNYLKLSPPEDLQAAQQELS